MYILIIFAFLAGIVTILSPCILPILPVILASSVNDPLSKRRPYGIVVGFVLSFTFFTLFLSTLVKAFGIPAESLRTFSVIVIGTFGLSLLWPKFQLIVESLFSRLANLIPSSAGKTGFKGGMFIGLSLGLLWTPCVGPILASVISLAISGTVTFDAVIITFAYALGTSIPMYLIIKGGGQALAKVPWLLRNTANIQKGFGIIMILTALAIYRGFDRDFQSYVLKRFPGYGAGLTIFEDVAFNKSQEIIKGDKAAELIVGGEWLGSEPLSLGELRGKVVIIDFWTYTCINCQRTLPYLKSWYAKYKDSGLVIIGVHSPEFEFEKDPKNVREAIADFGIKYPVMQDNNFATWRVYKNNYWPAKYIIDKNGIIRYTHFGEGKYDETERIIQELLRETGASIDMNISNPVTSNYARTPETYLGSKRSGNESYLKFEGKWVKSGEYSAPSKGSKLLLEYNAKSVYLVMRNKGENAVVKVYNDGVYIKSITIDKDTLYTLIDLDLPGIHKLQLEFQDNNAELFAFTFG